MGLRLSRCQVREDAHVKWRRRAARAACIAAWLTRCRMEDKDSSGARPCG
jgi:hypothetical protein